MFPVGRLVLLSTGVWAAGVTWTSFTAAPFFSNLAAASALFLLATSAASRLAFSWISRCFTGSLAIIEIRSTGTGVGSLKLSANFFSSINLTSLSAFALVLRTFSAFRRCWLANDLNSLRTSRSTVEVALGAMPWPSFAWGDIVRLVAADGRNEAEFWFVVLLSTGLCCGEALLSGLGSVGLAAGDAAGASTLGSGWGLLSSCLGTAGWFFCVFSCDDMIAGSTGTPFTVEEAVGARFAGGVYLLSRLLGKGGKSCPCRLTPLYLSSG